MAADVRERNVVTRGWTKTLPLDVVDFVEELGALPLAGVLVTAVHLEGLMEGTDLRSWKTSPRRAAWPVFASRRRDHRWTTCGRSNTAACRRGAGHGTLHGRARSRAALAEEFSA